MFPCALVLTSRTFVVEVAEVSHPGGDAVLVLIRAGLLNLRREKTGVIANGFVQQE